MSSYDRHSEDPSSRHRRSTVFDSARGDRGRRLVLVEPRDAVRTLGHPPIARRVGTELTAELSYVAETLADRIPICRAVHIALRPETPGRVTPSRTWKTSRAKRAKWSRRESNPRPLECHAIHDCSTCSPLLRVARSYHGLTRRSRAARWAAVGRVGQREQAKFRHSSALERHTANPVVPVQVPSASHTVTKRPGGHGSFFSRCRRELQNSSSTCTVSPSSATKVESSVP
jgi:hypothetical protein